MDSLIDSVLPTEKELSDIETRTARFGRVDLTVQERDKLCSALRALIEETEILRYKLLRRGISVQEALKECTVS